MTCHSFLSKKEINVVSCLSPIPKSGCLTLSAPPLISVAGCHSKPEIAADQNVRRAECGTSRSEMPVVFRIFENGRQTLGQRWPLAERFDGKTRPRFWPW
jgi:hypothetical protein